MHVWPCYAVSDYAVSEICREATTCFRHAARSFNLVLKFGQVEPLHTRQAAQDLIPSRQDAVSQGSHNVTF